PNSYVLEDIILQNNYTKKEKLKVIGHGSSNGIDTDEFNPELVSKATCKNLRLELNINQDDFVFLFVGRVVADKGINELVAAFTQLNERHNSTHLVIVGPYENQLDPLKSQTEDIINSNP